MNGKIIIMFFFIANILVLLFSNICFQTGTGCEEQFDNSFIEKFLIIDIEQDITQSGGSGIVISDNFSSAISKTVTPQGAGVSIISGVSVFLDGLKMIITILSILTPLPMLALLFSLGLPMFVNLLLTPLIIAWFLAVVEFIRGASFGN